MLKERIVEDVGQMEMPGKSVSIAGLTKLEIQSKENFDLVLDVEIKRDEMTRISDDWVIDGDFEISTGVLHYGKITGRLVSRGNVVVVAEGARIGGGVVCDVLICTGEITGDIHADQIVLGETGVIHGGDVHVRKGKFLTCAGSEFSGNLISL